MKPFPDRGRLTPEQRKFNLKLSALQCVVKRTFGMLKSWWRITLKRIEQKATTLKKTVIAACILHNICIERGDLYDTDYSDSDDSTDDGNWQQHPRHLKRLRVRKPVNKVETGKLGSWKASICFSILSNRRKS